MKNFPNYKLDNQNKKITNKDFPFQVTSIDGFAMLFNKKRLDKITQENYFDENFFMYLENDDLCKRIIDANEHIYIVPNSKIKHLGGKAVDAKYKNEVEFARNWHWIWSKFYFNKKHYGYLNALLKVSGKLFSSLIKIIFYALIFDKNKKKIYFQRFSGLYNSIIGKKSWYRPKIIIN